MGKKMLLFYLLLIFATEFDFSLISESDSIRPVVLICIFFVAALFFFKNYRISYVNHFSFYALICYVIYLMINFLITPMFDSKVNSLIGIYICFFSSLFCYKSFEYDSFTTSVVNVTLFLLVISFLLFFVKPSYVLNREELVRFKGVFQHSQRLSLVLSIGIILLFLNKNILHQNWKRILLIVLFVFVLLLTKTRANTTFLILVLFLYYFKGVNKVLLLFLMFFCFVLLEYTTLQSDFVSIYSRDSSDLTELTGRTKLWESVISEIYKKPIFGYGFGFFKTEPIQVFSWLPNHAHNLWLMQIYETGFVGAILFSTFLLGSLVISIKHLRSFGFSYLFYILIFIFLSSLTGVVVGGLVTPFYFMLILFYFIEANRVVSNSRVLVESLN